MKILIIKTSEIKLIWRVLSDFYSGTCGKSRLLGGL
jgi:hypothetical protein